MSNLTIQLKGEKTMEAEKLESLKNLPTADFVAAVAELKGEDLLSALGTRKTGDLYAIAEDESVPTILRYNIAKVVQNRMKKEIIEPFKELQKEEEAAEQKKAAAKAEERKKYAAEIDALFTEQLREAVLGIGKRYIEADLGTIVDVQLVVKKDAESGDIQLNYVSTLTKERATRKAGSGTGTGRGGAVRSVTVQGGDSEKGATVILAEPKHYSSFAEAVRDLKPIATDASKAKTPETDEEWEGFNAKRHLISKGYICEYVTPADEPTATEEKPAEQPVA